MSTNKKKRNCYYSPCTRYILPSSLVVCLGGVSSVQRRSVRAFNQPVEQPPLILRPILCLVEHGIEKTTCKLWWKYAKMKRAWGVLCHQRRVAERQWGKTWGIRRGTSLRRLGAENFKQALHWLDGLGEGQLVSL